MHIFPFGGLEVHFLVWISQELPPAVGMRLVLNEIDFFTGFKRVLAENLLNVQ